MTSSSRTARRAVAGAALTCVAALVTACGGSSGPAAAPATTITVTASAAASASTGATTPAPATSSAAPAGPGPCPTRSLGTKVGISQGTPGSTYTVVDFTNISGVTCTLYGYPGVSFTASKSGSQVQVGAAATESQAPERELVTLAPRAVANALLQIVHAGTYPAYKCDPVTADYLQIYPPNQTTPTYLSYTSLTCSKPVHILTVSVVQPGSGSSL